MVAEDYVHRIGRTGRAGVGGQAVSLVCVDEAELLRDIQRLLRRPLPNETVPGFEPDRSIRAERIALRSNDPGHRPANGRSGRGAAPRHGARPNGPRPAGPRPAGPKPRTAIHNGTAPRPAIHNGSARPSAPAHGDRRGAPGPRRPTALPGERISRAGAPSHDSYPSHHAATGSTGERNR